MITELELKFKSDTGTSATIDSVLIDDQEFIDVPTDEYLEWLEDLATKQLASEKKLAEIKSDFDELYYIIDNIDPDSDWSDIEEAKQWADIVLRKL